MKEQIQKDLYYIQNLLKSMDGMNQEERELSKRKKKLIEKKEPIAAPKKNTNPFIAVFLSMVLLLSVLNLYQVHTSAIKRYESAAFNDEFAWKMNHIDDDEPYPGYDGTAPSLVSSFFKAVLYALPKSAGVAAIVGVVFILQNESKKKSREQENKKIAEHNQNADLQNPSIIRHNQGLNEEIRNLHARKKTISKQYMAEVNAWFPSDYAYLTAVNFFIELVQKNRISCLRDDACSYEAYRTAVINEAADRFDQYQANLRAEKRHKELIRKEEQLVQQQMLGNMINTAIWATNVATYSRVNDAANTLTNINAKIPRF